MARKVCKRWNNLLISWNGFINSVVFVIAKDDEMKPSFSAFKSSSVQWKHVQIQNLTTSISLSGIWRGIRSSTSSGSDSLKLKVFRQKQNCVAGIELVGGQMYWSDVQDFLSQFPHLEELSIKNFSIQFKRAGTDGWFQKELDVQRFMDFQRRVKVLNFSFDNSENIIFYLKKFRGKQGL